MKTLLAVCLPYVAGSLLFVLPYVLVSCMGSDAPPDAHMDLDDKVLGGPKEEPTPEPSEQFGYLAHYQELPLTFPNTRPCVSVLLAQGVGERPGGRGALPHLRRLSDVHPPTDTDAGGLRSCVGRGWHEPHRQGRGAQVDG